MNKTLRLPIGLGCLTVLAVFTPTSLFPQQADVPEPAFINFTVEPPYQPVYKGRDPFKSLGVLDRSRQVSIGELKFNGVIKMGSVPIALFSWGANSNVRYTLKYRKLYMGDDSRMDGVVGDITETEVVLVQGDRRIVFKRPQRRP